MDTTNDIEVRILTTDEMRATGKRFPKCRLSKDGFRLNESCLNMLDTRDVLILFDREKDMLFFKPVDKDSVETITEIEGRDLEAIPEGDLRGHVITLKRKNKCKALCSKIFENMDWDKKATYTVFPEKVEDMLRMDLRFCVAQIPIDYSSAVSA